jgi:hypothetical protein
MNIFYLDRDPLVCAQMHCDKHVVKMIVETAQLLSTAAREYGCTAESLYKSTHKNHPSAVWVRQSAQHYEYALHLLYYLLLEYTWRYKKQHKTIDLLSDLITARQVIPDNGWISDPPQCMPDDCMGYDTVAAYRKYYITHKAHFATWKSTKAPYWWNVLDNAVAA